MLVILAGRLDQAGKTEEAAELRQRAREAGEYLVLQPAIRELEQAGGSLEDFEALLRGPAEAGVGLNPQTIKDATVPIMTSATRSTAVLNAPCG